MSGALDRYRLYELCAQSPGDVVQLLRAIHGGGAMVLGEDFCGTAAVSAVWVRAVEGGRAIAVDCDLEPLSNAARDAAIEIVCGDVVDATSPDRHRVDVLYAGNFSIGERHTRADLLTYLRHARSRLRPGGVFVCDTYGGRNAWITGSTRAEHRLPDGRVVRYTWEQREADPTTGRVVDAMHFRVVRGGKVEAELRDAFVYRWRLWGVPELRDALLEAGFESADVYRKVPDAVDDDGAVYVSPVSDPAQLEESFDVLVAGRRGPADTIG